MVRELLLSVIILLLGLFGFFEMASSRIDHRGAFLANQTWLSEGQLETLQNAKNPADFAEHINQYMTSNRNGMAAHEEIFEGCLSYLEPKIGNEMNGIKWFFEKQSEQSPFEKVDIKSAMRVRLSEYQDSIEDAWELEGYKFCRNVLENRQPKTLYQFLDWMDPFGISTSAQLYEDNNYVGLVEYIGRNIVDLILDERFDDLKNVTLRIADACDYGIRYFIDSKSYAKYKKAKDLKYFNAAYEFVEYTVNKLPNHQNELKAAFRMCQKLDEISPNEPRNRILEMEILVDFVFSKCTAQLMERKVISKLERDYEKYMDIVIDFYKKKMLAETVHCAKENLGICEKFLKRRLERSAHTCYRETQYNYTNFLRENLCEKNEGAKKLMGYAFGKTYSSTLQTMEEFCQHSLDLMCRDQYGTNLQKNIRLKNKPTFDFVFYERLEKFDRTRLWFDFEESEDLLNDEPFETLESN